MESVRDISSASAKEYQTAWRPHVFAKNQARGRMHKSCLATDTIRLYTPFPSAWNTDPMMMQYPANKKLKLMIRRAGTPTSSICGEALNMPRSCGVNAWKMIRPQSMMPTA